MFLATVEKVSRKPLIRFGWNLLSTEKNSWSSFTQLPIKFGTSVTPSEKRDLEAKVKFYTTSDWRNLELEARERRRSLSGGFWPPLLTVLLCFLTLFFHTPRHVSFFQQLSCHNPVTTKHVATSTLILRSIELRAGDATSCEESGGKRKRVEASSCRSARVCSLFQYLITFKIMQIQHFWLHP